MRILVFGGRDYADYAAVERALSAVHAKRGITLIIEGGALGADRHARNWAMFHNVPHQTYEANWRAHGRAAGPMRNTLMLAEGKPDGAVAFPGGRGTADMERQAIAAGVKVWRPMG